VKPQVNDSGLVALELDQEVSDLGDTVIIGTESFPSLTKIEATSNLVVRDGETVAIGGLIKENKTDSRSGIPLQQNPYHWGPFWNYKK
jgi:general secretion pathway protein D